MKQFLNSLPINYKPVSLVVNSVVEEGEEISSSLLGNLNWLTVLVHSRINGREAIVNCTHLLMSEPVHSAVNRFI